MPDDPELIPVRPEERLDVRRLEGWLRARLPDAEGPLGVRQFGGGHANLTYLVTLGTSEYVLRRPPAEELELILEAVTAGIEALPVLIEQGAERAKTQLHSRGSEPQPHRKPAAAD